MPQRPRHTRIAADDLALFRRVSRTLQAPPAPAPLALTIPADASWDEVLDECVRQLGAIAAFVIDDRGLLVAGTGAMALGTLEGTGARLVIAVHQADHMEAAVGGARGITLEFDGQWLTGIRVATESTPLIVGLFTAAPLDLDARRAVAEAFAPLGAGVA